MNRWVDFYENVMGFKLLITFDDKDIFTEYETTYATAKESFDEGDMLPSEWDTIEEKYLMMNEELDFLKTELQKMNDQITQYQKDIARLKKETGLLQYKSYREF